MFLMNHRNFEMADNRVGIDRLDWMECSFPVVLNIRGCFDCMYALAVRNGQVPDSLLDYAGLVETDSWLG
jgi:hypothetical protein